MNTPMSAPRVIRREGVASRIETDSLGCMCDYCEENSAAVRFVFLVHYDPGVKSTYICPACLRAAVALVEESHAV